MLFQEALSLKNKICAAKLFCSYFYYESLKFVSFYSSLLFVYAIVKMKYPHQTCTWTLFLLYVSKLQV